MGRFDNTLASGGESDGGVLQPKRNVEKCGGEVKFATYQKVGTERSNDDTLKLILTVMSVYNSDKC